VLDPSFQQPYLETAAADGGGGGGQKHPKLVSHGQLALEA
jgi:hypothetical protein